MTAQTAGRCRTESEDELVCRGCTQCSRLYCRERRNRTGNVFSAAIGSRTFKHAECVRHEELEACHRNERGSIRCRFGHGGAGLRRLKRWYALRCSLPSRRRSQESSAALYYVGYVSMTPGPSSLSGRNQPSVRLGLSWAASRPAAAGALGWPGGREENEAELGVSFGPNRGAIVHFSTSSPTWPPKRIAARAASQRLPRPFGPRQSPVGAKLRNYPEKFGRHTVPDLT